MLQLFLTMLSAYDSYKEDIGFTQSDIDNLFNNHIKKLLNNNELKCNERGYLLLYKKNYISKEYMIKHFNTGCYYVKQNIDDDNNIILICNKFDDILPNRYKTEISILDGDDDSFVYNDYKDFDVESYWKDFNKDSLLAIQKYCISNYFEVEGEELTNDNLKLKNGELYFNDEKFEDIVFENEDDFDDLIIELSIAIGNAYSVSERSEVYNELKQSFINKIGDFKYNKDDKLEIKLNISLSEIDDYLKENYDDYEFEEETYGSIYHILNEMDYFDIDAPNYNYLYVNMNNEILNDEIVNRL